MMSSLILNDTSPLERRSLARPILVTAIVAWLLFTVVCLPIGAYPFSLIMAVSAPLPESYFGFTPRGHQVELFFGAITVVYIVVAAVAWVRRVTWLAASVALYLIVGIFVACFTIGGSE